MESILHRAFASKFSWLPGPSVGSVITQHSLFCRIPQSSWSILISVKQVEIKWRMLTSSWTCAVAIASLHASESQWSPRKWRQLRTCTVAKSFHGVELCNSVTAAAAPQRSTYEWISRLHRTSRWVADTPSYSGSRRLRSSPRAACSAGVVRDFPQRIQSNAEIVMYLNWGHYRFLQHRGQYIIH
jgi:hypothetical protein